MPIYKQICDQILCSITTYIIHHISNDLFDPESGQK